MRLTIAHLYPDLFHLYGDQGNILALSQRLLWRGVDCQIDRISLGDPFRADQYDIVYLGGGLELQNKFLQQDLQEKSGAIRQAVEKGCVCLAVNGGFWVMGEYLELPDGSRQPGLGIIDAFSELAPKRVTGQVVAYCDKLAQAGSDPLLLGFINRQTSTWLGAGATALAKIRSGPGNSAGQKTEGAIYKNLYCTYMLGGFLPLNPQLTDQLLETAVKRRFPDFPGLKKLTDPYTKDARNNLFDCS